MNLYKIYIALFFIIISFAAISQERAGIWYFGRNAGLDFCNGAPVALTDGAMNTKEGCASISDRNCNLLFYTDGIRVWNREHRLMANGFGLYGDSSATQSGVIVPHPGNDSLYYLFTVDDNLTTYGFRYSIINMNLDNGLGDVTVKNVELIDECVEKIASVYHENGKDIWVIAHEWNSNVFRAYLLTENGLTGSPVISSVGYVHSGSSDSQNKIGYLTASPNGDKLACAVKYSDLLEIFDFDNSSGVISNPSAIQDGAYHLIYGVGFSPEGKRLYVGSRSQPYRFYQFNMEAGSGTDIINSSVKLAESQYEFGAIQAGPDGKMYIALKEHDFLAVINQPEELGMVCDFVHDGIYLAGRKSALGLPTFIQTYFKPEITLSYNGPVCEGESIFLMSTFVSGVEYLWTGPANFSSTIYNPVLAPATPNMTGIYQLRVILGNNIDTSYYKINVTVNPLPDVSIIPWQKQVILKGDSIILNVSPIVQEYSYSWSTGETLTELVVKESGIYTVYAENEFGCIDSFSVEVSVVDMPDISIASDKSDVLCFGDSLILSAVPYNTDFKYFWSTGETGRSITVRSSGTYSVIIENTDNLRKESAGFIVRVETNRLAIADESKTINFDTTYFADIKCLPIRINNVSDEPFTINDIFLMRNIEFSIPQDQYDVLINPGESDELLICYSPSKLGLQTDTLIIRDSCMNHLITLTAFGSGSTYYGDSDCDIKIIMTSTGLDNKYKALIFPNPIDEIATINYFIEDDADISISIYNIMGQEVINLFKGHQMPGEYTIKWIPDNLPNGIYFYVFKVDLMKQSGMLVYRK
ncbi:T9SS type A sorting domain-containing protein [Bacteroidota bacterium]